MATSFYSEEELQQMGFAHVGHDVMISRKASIYGASNIWIGNHVRVDDFCVHSGIISMWRLPRHCLAERQALHLRIIPGFHRTVQFMPHRTITREIL